MVAHWPWRVTHRAGTFQLLEYQWWEGKFDTLGKLVSAHRAWRHTLHGGCASIGGAGLPPWCATFHGQCATILMMHDHIFTVWH